MPELNCVQLRSWISKVDLCFHGSIDSYSIFNQHSCKLGLNSFSLSILVSFNCHFLSELIDLSGWIWVDNCKWPTIGDVTNWVTNWVNKGQPLWEYILFSLQTVIKFKSAATSRIYTLSVWLSELDLAKLEWAKLDLAKLELTKLELAKLG